MIEQRPQNLEQLIVTRPSEQAKSLIDQFQQKLNGHYSIDCLPLLAIEPIRFELPCLEDFAGVIFVSGNAVKYLSQHPDFHPTRVAKAQLFAIGDASAAQVNRYLSRKAIYPQQMNAEGLCELTALQSITGQQWLLVKGKGGREAIQNTFSERGATLTSLNVYQRQMPSAKIQQSIIQRARQNPLWLVTSAEAMDNLMTILQLEKHPNHKTRVIVSSQRLADLAKQKGFSIIAQSAGASEQQLVQCVTSLIGT